MTRRLQAELEQDPRNSLARKYLAILSPDQDHFRAYWWMFVRLSYADLLLRMIDQRDQTVQLVHQLAETERLVRETISYFKDLTKMYGPDSGSKSAVKKLSMYFSLEQLQYACEYYDNQLKSLERIHDKIEDNLISFASATNKLICDAYCMKRASNHQCSNMIGIPCETHFSIAGVANLVEIEKTPMDERLSRAIELMHAVSDDYRPTYSVYVKAKAQFDQGQEVLASNKTHDVMRALLDFFISTNFPN